MVLPAAAVDGVHLLAECRPVECRPVECRPVVAVTAVRPAADGSLPVVLPAECRPVEAVTAVRPAADGSLPVVLLAERRPVVMALLPAAMAARPATALLPAVSVAASLLPPEESRPNSVVRPRRRPL